MTQVTCEAASFANACQRAFRVAPTKGAPFDKAQGIILQVRPDTNAPFRILATDLESTYFQKVPNALATGESVTWRVPAAMLAGVAGNLPLGSGQTVDIFDEDGFVHMHVGRSKARLRPLIIEDYPFSVVKPFPVDELKEIPDFASRVQQVAWAVAEARAPLSGVHIDGLHLYGCDGVKLAMVPCVVPVSEPITVPMQALTTLLRDVGPIRAAAIPDRLRLMLDGETQITTVIYHEKYPNVRQVIRDDYMDEVIVEKEPLIEMVNSMMVLVRNVRYPYVKLIFGHGELGVELGVPDIGKMENVLDVRGGPSTPFAITCTPQVLTDALTAAGRSEVRIAFGPRVEQILRIADDDRYETHMMPVVPRGVT